MSVMELELQKIDLARAILTTTDENIIKNIWLFLKGNNNFVVSQQRVAKKRRKIGILDGKAKIIFHDDWSMTPEELLELK